MGIGVMVTSGSLDVPLAPSILQYITEVRVEQELSKAYRFAIRFEEDICGEFMENGSQRDLQPGMQIAVIVPEGDDGAQCLVRGPILKVKTSVVTGGQGSWYEIHGEDRRAEMGRDSFSATFTGETSAVVKRLCDKYGIDVDVQDTVINHVETPTPDQAGKLSQSGTDLAFIENAARTEGFEFWVEYQPLARTALTDTDPVGVQEKFQFKSSPPRSTGQPATAPLTLPQLGAADAGVLLVNVTDATTCLNTLSFALEVDAERASSAYFAALNPQNELQRDQAFNPGPPMDPNGATSAQPVNTQFPMLGDTHGTPAERRLRAEAALLEQSWFITATCSTSMFLYRRVLYPHKIVEVRGLGDMHDGSYQVSKVIHVINSHGHLMDLTLRRNSFRIDRTRSAAMTPELAHVV